MGKRFRIRTVHTNQPATHHYLSTIDGVEKHLLKKLKMLSESGDYFRINLFDYDRRDEWGQLIHAGHIGAIGGLTNRRSDLIAIARLLQSEQLAKMFKLHEGEWKNE